MDASIRYLDGARFVLLRARQEYRQHAVAILGLDFVGIDLDWQVQRPTKAAGGSFAAVNTDPITVSDRLGAGNLDRPALDLYVQLVLFEAGCFRDDDDIVTFAEQVKWRKPTGGAGARTKPRAAAEGIERLLQLQQGFEWIRIEHGS